MTDAGDDVPATGVAVDQLLEALAAYDQTDDRASQGLAAMLAGVARQTSEEGNGPLALVWARFALVVAAVCDDKEPLLNERLP